MSSDKRLRGARFRTPPDPAMMRLSRAEGSYFRQRSDLQSVDQFFKSLVHVQPAMGPTVHRFCAGRPVVPNIARTPDARTMQVKDIAVDTRRLLAIAQRPGGTSSMMMLYYVCNRFFAQGLSTAVTAMRGAIRTLRFARGGNARIDHCRPIVTRSEAPRC